MKYDRTILSEKKSIHKTIYFTVTNDLTYDQRMHRICSSLAGAGYNITLVGRKLKASIPLQQKNFHQQRLRCWFNAGSLFYFEYNLRLFFFLFPKKMDGICAIDLDTILPVYVLSKLKRTKRIYDAHEYFTELKEVRTRPLIKKIWSMVERFAVPKFRHSYTVSEGVANEFRKKYKNDFVVIRNVPILQNLASVQKKEKFILYQGAVNEGRGFEFLVPAMKNVSYKLVVCGDGNFMTQLKELIKKYNVENKFELKGMMLPENLRQIAAEATLGIALSEQEGINQLQALPNKFLDYMHAGLPQIAMNFPEYRKINSQHKVAVLLDKLDADEIAITINSTMQNEKLLNEMQQNAFKARELYCWQNEEKILLHFYNQVFN